MKIIYSVNTDNLNGALKILSQHSKKAPIQVVTMTALFCVKKAQENTPVVSQGRILTDMQVVTTPVLSTKGARKGLPLKSGEYDMEVPEQSMAVKIALARLHPNSKYSKLTGNRWALPMPDFHGRRDKGSAFWGYIKQSAERMVRARKSSTAYLKASWSAIIYKLQAEVNKYGRSGTVTIESSRMKSTLMSGDIEVSRGGSDRAYVKIFNTLGMNAENKTLGEKHNQAAHRYLTPALNRAIQSEFDGKVQVLARKGLLDLNLFFNQFGFRVS